MDKLMTIMSDRILDDKSMKDDTKYDLLVSMLKPQDDAARQMIQIMVDISPTYFEQERKARLAREAAVA